MSVSIVADFTKRIVGDEAVREAVARGEIDGNGLTQEEKEALTSLARRLQQGEDLPTHLSRPRSALFWWIGPPPD